MACKFNVYDITWENGVDLPDEVEILLNDEVVDSDPQSDSSDELEKWEKMFEAAVIDALFKETGHHPANNDFSFEPMDEE